MDSSPHVAGSLYDSNSLALSALPITRIESTPYDSDSETQQEDDSMNKSLHHLFTSHPKPTLESSDETRPPWMPGMLRHAPWDSLVTLCIAVLATISCAVLLHVSNGAHVEDWIVSVPVCLAILTATANASLRYSLSGGTNTAWWLRALRGGTILKLQEEWEYGVRLTSAVSAGKDFSFVALASILVTAVVIDGPLLQRASSSAYIGVKNESVTVKATLATELPYGYSGYETATSPMAPSWLLRQSKQFLTPEFQEVVQNYTTRQPIAADSFMGCTGICSGSLNAAGLRANCSETRKSVQWLMANSTTIVFSKTGAMFSINFAWAKGQEGGSHYILPLPSGTPIPDEPYIKMQVIYSQSTTEDGISFSGNVSEDAVIAIAGSDLVYRDCELYATTNVYPLIIHNDTNGEDHRGGGSANVVTLNGRSVPLEGTEQSVRTSVYNSANGWNLSGVMLLSDPAYFASGIARQSERLYLHETLSGVASAAQNLFGSTFTFDGFNQTGSDQYGYKTTQNIGTSGMLSTQFLRSDSAAFQGGLNSSDYLGFTFDDPTPYLLSSLDEIMFRAALHTAYKNTNEKIELWIDIYDGTMPRKPSLESFPKFQLVSMHQQRTTLMYQSNYSYLTVAMIVMFLASAAVAPTFYGFWALGRVTSLSPFEIAKALGAHVLEGGSSNSSSKQLMKKVGATSVQYGRVVDPDGRTRLTFADPALVERPCKGDIYN